MVALVSAPAELQCIGPEMTGDKNDSHLLQGPSKVRHLRFTEMIALVILYQRCAETWPINTFGLCYLLIGFPTSYENTYEINLHTIKKTLEHGIVLGELF